MQARRLTLNINEPNGVIGELLYTFLIKGLLHIIESQVHGMSSVPWKLIDMGRSLSVNAVWLRMNNGEFIYKIFYIIYH